MLTKQKLLANIQKYGYKNEILVCKNYGPHGPCHAYGDILFIVFSLFF